MARYRLLVLFWMTFLPLAAEDADLRQRFAGTWEARFKGTVFCTIKLKAGERITGATYACSIHVNQAGELEEPQPSDDPDTPEPLLSPEIEGDTLSFEMADESDVHLKMSLKLVGDGAAELRFLNAPVEIKPIRFERK